MEKKPLRKYEITCNPGREIRHPRDVERLLVWMEDTGENQVQICCRSAEGAVGGEGEQWVIGFLYVSKQDGLIRLQLCAGIEDPAINTDGGGIIKTELEDY